MANGKVGAPLGNKNAKGGKQGLRVGMYAGALPRQAQRLVGSTIGYAGDSRQIARYAVGSTVSGGLKGATKGALVGVAAGALIGGTDAAAIAGAAAGAMGGSLANAALNANRAKRSLRAGQHIRKAVGENRPAAIAAIQEYGNRGSKGSVMSNGAVGKTVELVKKAQRRK